MKLKGLHFADVAEIQEAVTDKLKKVQKEEFSAAFRKLYDRPKTCLYANGAYFEKKKVCVFLECLRFKKKSVLKLSNLIFISLHSFNFVFYVAAVSN